ncbi:MAG: VWA domain-containing protein [Pantoea sp.]|uniref:VWA domain-containing protein n=1 Tax=Pantoea sp. TaxID=69393 RepID=UPI0039E6D033
MSDFHFLYPWRLLALLLCPLLFLITFRAKSAWYRIMDKSLADALVVKKSRRWQQSLPWLFALAILALAGPSWQKVLPDALTPKSNVMVILQQDLSMLAQDLPPNRQQRVQQKLMALMQQMPGSRFGLVVYRAQAFLTTPLTDDLAFYSLFLYAQQPQQLPDAQGSGLQAAFRLANQYLPNDDQSPRALVLVADSLSSEDARWLQQQSLPLQIWVPGTSRGGPLPEALAGRGIDSRLNVARFEQMQDSGIPVTLLSVTDNQDLQALIAHIQQTASEQQNARKDLQWKNSGYWLLLPMMALLLMWRRQLLCLVLLPLLLMTAPYSKAAWLDAWVPPDIQGQHAFDRGDYATAAAHYHDPLRRAVAFYFAADYTAALNAFRQLPASADNLLWTGNCYAQMKQWQQALNSYDQALSLRPDWSMARENRRKISLIIMELRKKERERQASQGEQADEDPDAIKQDLKADEGVNQQDIKPLASASPQLSQWYDNLSLSPGGLLENLYHAAPEETP